MKRRIAVVIALLSSSLVGCAQTVADVALQNRAKINQLSLGMNREEVDRVMGPATVTVRAVGLFSNTEIANPHESEAVRGKAGDTIEVRYYPTEVLHGEHDEESSFTEDELTPLVFRDRQLLGWGWNLLFENVDRTQLHYRYDSNRPRPDL